MDLFSKYISEYFLILGIYISVYTLLSGTAYMIIYMVMKEHLKFRKIQNRAASRKSIYREIKWSLISITVLAFLTLLIVRCIQNGYTAEYGNINDYGWMYFFGSIIISILINDTYFYWMHRFMHLKAIFPRVHKIHHLSKTPTPWAIFAFNPIENLIDFAIFPLLIFFVPLHPAALAIIVSYNLIMNLGGHFGFEFVPKGFHHHWLFRYSLTVTHHDMHHAKVNCNYGLYFNIWDRLMKTNHPDYEKTFMKVQDQIKNASYEHSIPRSKKHYSKI